MARPAPPSRDRVGYLVAGALALIPFLRMASVVRHAASLQYSDYWLLLEHYTNAGGGLRFAGLFEFEFQNHVVVLPMLLYWLNVQLFAGSNVALGVMVLLLGLGLLTLVALMLWRSELPSLDRMVLFVLASSLIFTPNGTWNYGIAMSGTAWLGAGLLGVVAVYLRSRDRPVLAFVTAALAPLTYATGLMVWPALVAVGCCRRAPRAWWKELPFVAAFVVNYLWFRQVQTTGLGAELPWPNAIDGGRLLARLLAFPLGVEGTPAEVIGFAVLAATIGLVLWGVARARTRAAAMWVGVAVFGVLGTLSLAFGRYIFITYFGSQNRYTSVPTLALIGAAGLAMALLHGGDEPGADEAPGRTAGSRQRSGRAGAVAIAVIGLVVIATTATGGAHLEDMRHKVKEQELREVALHLGIADDNRYLAGFDTAVTDLLIDLDHQPFDGGWQRDCGLIDEPLPDAGDAEPHGAVTKARHLLLLSDAVELTGYVEASDVECVVVTGDDGTVLGASTIDVDGVEGAGADDTTFIAIARPAEAAYRVWALPADDGAPLLVAVVDDAAIEPAGPSQAPPEGSTGA